MREKLKLWLTIKSLKDVVAIAQEMEKWSEYLKHSAEKAMSKRLKKHLKGCKYCLIELGGNDEVRE